MHRMFERAGTGATTAASDSLPAAACFPGSTPVIRRRCPRLTAARSGQRAFDAGLHPARFQAKGRWVGCAPP